MFQVGYTQTVTVLFTDMVGSTESPAQLGLEATDQVRHRHFSLLRQALAGTGGSEVRNLGDGLMATFSSSSAAADCAVAMQQAVEQENRRAPHPMGLRVGLSGGDVTIEQGDCLGDPVVEAARLCSMGQSGQILASDTVRVIAGRRSQHSFVGVGVRQLKGLPDEIDVYEVTWEPVAAVSRVPLPDSLRTPDSDMFGFFGRDADRRLLTDAVRGAAQGSHYAALLAGEPGIGKTSLSRQVAQEAHALGICVLYGHCEEEASGPLQAFAEALDHFVVHADEALLTRYTAEYGGSLAQAVPALQRRIPETVAGSSSSAGHGASGLELFHAVVGLLAMASAEAGLLVVLEDLHWADRTTLDLLREVVASPQLSKVMVLGTYRDSDLQTGDPLSDTLASLRRDAEVVRIDLPGLEDFEIVEIMEHICGHDMDDAGWLVARAIKKETDGNPFFATEMLWHLIESRLLRKDESGRWVASSDIYDMGLPGSIREVIGQRIDRLGEEMRPVLSLASAIGEEFDLRLLAKAAGLEEDRVQVLLNEAKQAGIVVEVDGAVDRFRFSHSLTQHTLYRDLGAARRTSAHRKIAEALVDIYGDSDEQAQEVVRHYVDATLSFPRFQRNRYGTIQAQEEILL